MRSVDLYNFIESGQLEVAGKIREEFPLGKSTWLSAGGNVDVLFAPDNLNDLSNFLKQLPSNIPLFVVGRGSNIIVRDGGVAGVVVRLSASGFGEIERVGSNKLKVGAAVLDKNLAEAALEYNIGGFAFYKGIPGKIGGALRMNAGANGTETSDRVVEVYAIDRQGNQYTLSNSDMKFKYRTCGVSNELIFTGALFQGFVSDPSQIKKEMNDVDEHRKKVQPVGVKTAGSTFKNPASDVKAGVLIEKANLKGYAIGDAIVSDKHANFLINRGNASAHDIENLGEYVRKCVQKIHNVSLEWEVKRLGDFKI